MLGLERTLIRILGGIVLVLLIYMAVISDVNMRDGLCAFWRLECHLQ